MQLGNTDRVSVLLLVANPEENRLVMGVIQKYRDQAHSSSHHRLSYNKGHGFTPVCVISLYLEYYCGKVASYGQAMQLSGSGKGMKVARVMVCVVVWQGSQKVPDSEECWLLVCSCSLEACKR
jgi:hypothetical protein